MKSSCFAAAVAKDYFEADLRESKQCHGFVTPIKSYYIALDRLESGQAADSRDKEDSLRIDGEILAGRHCVPRENENVNKASAPALSSVAMNARVAALVHYVIFALSCDMAIVTSRFPQPTKLLTLSNHYLFSSRPFLRQVSPYRLGGIPFHLRLVPTALLIESVPPHWTFLDCLWLGSFISPKDHYYPVSVDPQHRRSYHTPYPATLHSVFTLHCISNHVIFLLIHS